MRSRSFVSPLLFCAAIAAPLGAQGVVEVGHAPSHSFREAMIQGQGVKSLADLRGKPVLVEFWGINCAPCVGAAVPGALKKLEEFGSDLEVIFIESQAHTREQLTAFGLTMKWFGRGGRWTTEAPFQTGSNGIPNYVLLDVNGKVLAKGNPLADEKMLHDLITAQIEGKKAADDATPKAVAKAMKDFAKGKSAAAIAALEKLATENDAELAAAASAALDQAKARIESRLARIEWSAANGEYLSAGEQVKLARKAFEGLADAQKRLDAVATQLASPELAAEVDAEKKLQKLERSLFEEGPSEAIAAQLAKFAEKNQGTKAAERAALWSKHSAAPYRG
ncbi:MAG: TlpA family protein disulfide reductase [Planctomycetes bacterium]|nr:TlpA family protein disulfide reductase [Planctomycetota bacterium]